MPDDDLDLDLKGIFEKVPKKVWKVTDFIIIALIAILLMYVLYNVETIKEHPCLMCIKMSNVCDICYYEEQHGFCSLCKAEDKLVIKRDFSENLPFWASEEVVKNWTNRSAKPSEQEG